jgi:hypothetical protein
MVPSFRAEPAFRSQPPNDGAPSKGLATGSKEFVDFGFSECIMAFRRAPIQI